MSAPALSVGTRLGPYEVLALVGEGGMGQVYRARDTVLHRDVALKVLLPAVASDPDRLARFDREARVLASLNHPYIAQVHGLETGDGRRALVMEFVEGQTLADRLAQGALPIDEALAIARQIAEALEAAHERQIVHRDLKPANIKLRPDGTVKVLDFGLAKALDSAAPNSDDATISPTISRLTANAGMILGTAAYMSPEQARGKDVDRRTDLWAFGCVLFEMLTGRRAFQADDVTDTIVAVLTREPDWRALPAATPRSIGTLLRRCLAKEPKRRLDSAAAARVEIEEAFGQPGVDQVRDRAQHTGTQTRRLGSALTLALAAAVVGSLVTWAVGRKAAVSAPISDEAVSRFSLTLPQTMSLAYSFNDRDLALSQDGTRLVFTAGDEAQLMVRHSDHLDAEAVPGVVNARAPFLSPDARWVAYFERLDEGANVAGVVARTAIRRVALTGGPGTEIATVTGASRGAVWGTDNAIVLATNDPATGILRLAPGSTEPTVLTTPDATKGELDHYFPSPLPDGRGLLFTILEPGRRQVAVLDARTGERRTIVSPGSQAEYLDSGHVVYADRGTLWGIAFDLATLQTRGEPAPLVEQVLTLGAAEFAVTRRGTLAYVPVAGGRNRSLVWVARDGSEEPLAAPLRSYMRVRISPDGQRAAVQLQAERHHQIWMWDFSRANLTSFLFDASFTYLNPTWSHDGAHLIFGLSRNASTADLYRRATNGPAEMERLTNTDRTQRTNAATRDGFLIFEELTQNAGYDFVRLALDGSGRRDALLQTPYDERDASLSPDGRWLTYESNEAGQSQVFVRPYPAVQTTRYLVSGGGGRTPVWSPTGREIFFADRQRVVSVPVQTSPTFSAGTPVTLFAAPSLLLDGRLGGTSSIRTFDVARDGRRFLMIKNLGAARDDGTPVPSMIVVQNWLQEVRARVK